MENFLAIDISNILAAALVVTLGVVFYLVHKVRKLEKIRDEDKVVMRVKILEKEVEHYIRRSQRRLDIFKRVIDGFEHVMQGIKGVISEEESETIESYLDEEERELLARQSENEAEIIHLEKQLD